MSYQKHNFIDVSDSVSQDIDAVNRYKIEGKIETANTEADSRKIVLGDGLSAQVINELEQGIVNLEALTILKKKTVLYQEAMPVGIYENQVWISSLEMEDE